MVPEPRLEKSIPRVGLKEAFGVLLDGLPVASREYGLTLGIEITSDELSSVLSRLSGADRSVGVRARFKMGDMWNELHTNAYRVVRARWLCALRIEMPNHELREKYLMRFRRFGCVAAHWLEKDRSDARSWTWYVNGCKPRGGKSARKSALQSVDGNMLVKERDGYIVECVMPDGSPLEVRVRHGIPTRNGRSMQSDGLCEDVLGGVAL